MAQIKGHKLVEKQTITIIITSDYPNVSGHAVVVAKKLFKWLTHKPRFTAFMVVIDDNSKYLLRAYQHGDGS